MTLEVQFRELKAKDKAGLAEYLEERLERLKKFELKPISIRALFSSERQMIRLQINASGADVFFTAKTSSFDSFEAVDKAIAKLTMQMSKKKQASPTLREEGIISLNQKQQYHHKDHLF